MEHIDSIVKASCALHNFLISALGHTYAPQESLASEDIEHGTINTGFTLEDSNMEPLLRSRVGNASLNAKQAREGFMNYFVNEGQVPWQHNFIH